MCGTTQAIQPFKALLTSKAKAIFEIARRKDGDVDRLKAALEREYLKTYRGAYNDLIRQTRSRVRMFIIPRGTRDKIVTKSQKEARDIVDTFNRELSTQIERILAENPAFSRKEVLVRLRAWHLAREQWKVPQVSLWVNRSAVNLAQEDFLRQNASVLRNVRARIAPRTAVCARCQRLIDMGDVDRETAERNPCPVHVNCVHQWVYRFSEVNLPILENLILRVQAEG